MENASKALIMAGSVLLSILIIGSLVFMFNQVTSLKQTEASSADVEKLAKYNNQIEAFERTLYGSELLSLCNLIADYNNRQAGLKGYEPIKIQVTMNEIIDAKYLKNNYIDEKKIVDDFIKLEKELNKAKNEKMYGETIEKLASMNSNLLEHHLIKYGKTEEQASNEVNFSSELNSKISQYQNYKSELTEFKNKKFSKPTYTYSNQTGRVVQIIVTE